MMMISSAILFRIFQSNLFDDNQMSIWAIINSKLMKREMTIIFLSTGHTVLDLVLISPPLVSAHACRSMPLPFSQQIILQKFVNHGYYVTRVQLVGILCIEFLEYLSKVRLSCPELSNS